MIVTHGQYDCISHDAHVKVDIKNWHVQYKICPISMPSLHSCGGSSML